MGSNDSDEKKDGVKHSRDESHSSDHDSDDEGEIQEVKPEHGEPADHLKRRSDWFQKRHGGS